MDIQKLSKEEDDWRVVQTKSAPFYDAALQVGALLGGASLETTDQLKAKMIEKTGT